MLGPLRLPDRCHAGDDRIDLGVNVEEVHLGARVHLHRREALRNPRRDIGHDVLRPVAADPGVEPDAIADPPSK